MTLAELLNQQFDNPEITNILLKYFKEIEPQEQEETLKALRSRRVPGQGEIVEVTGVRTILINWKDVLLRGLPQIALIAITVVPVPMPNPSLPQSSQQNVNPVEEVSPQQPEVKNLLQAALMALIALQTFRAIWTITLNDKHARIAIELWRTHKNEGRVEYEKFKQEITSKFLQISAEDFENIVDDLGILGITKIDQGQWIIKREALLIVE